MPSASPQFLRAIAEATGFSRMTVSRVLRGAPHVSEETRKRILAAKEQLGYHPNPLVSTLMASMRRGSLEDSGETLAFVSAFPTADGWNHYPTIVRMRQGAAARAAELGFRLEDFWQGGFPPNRLSTILHTRGIHGLIFAPFAAAGATLEMEWDWFASVALEFTMTRPLLHRVSGNRFESLRIAVRELRRRGYFRPGLFLERGEDDRINDFWSAAALQENQRIRQPVPPLLVDHYERGMFEKWIKKHEPDCVLCIHDEIVVWLEEMGRRVPEDIGLIHINLNPQGRGKLAGIDGRSESVGRSAVDTVVAQIHRNEWGIPKEPVVTLIEGMWVEGGSVLATRGAGKKRRADLKHAKEVAKIS